MDKPLAKLIRIKREKTQITTIRKERDDISTDSPDSRGVIREYYEQFYNNKFGKLEEMD